MRDLLRHRDFRVLLTGQVVSMFGDTVFLLGLAIWTKMLTGSSALAGSVILCFVIPGLAAPLFGVLIDRFPRRRVLLVNDGASAVFVLLLLLVDGREDLWIIYLVALLYGTALVVGSSARSALLPSVVDDEILPAANASLTTAREALRLVGPLTGAALIAAFGGHALALLDSATFVVSVICLLLIHPVEAPSTRASVPFRAEVMAGLHHILGTPVLRRLLVVGLVFCSAVGISESVYFAVVDQGLHRSPTFLGVLSTTQGIGAIAGGVTSAFVIKRLGELHSVGLGALSCAVGAGLSTSSMLPVVILGTLFFGAALPLLIVASVTLIQRRTPNELQGRVLTGFSLAESVPQTASIAIGALLVAVVDYRLLLLAMALGLALSGVAALVPVRHGVPLDSVPDERDVHPIELEQRDVHPERSGQAS
jgi:MFS family permease